MFPLLLGCHYRMPGAWQFNNLRYSVFISFLFSAFFFLFCFVFVSCRLWYEKILSSLQYECDIARMYTIPPVFVFSLSFFYILTIFVSNTCLYHHQHVENKCASTLIFVLLKIILCSQCYYTRFILIWRNLEKIYSI